MSDMAEAICCERTDVDLEAAEFERAADEMEADRKRGICWHTSRLGYVFPAVYAIQEHLTPGQEVCLLCGKVYEAGEPGNWSSE